jgi:hypothetical protein
MNSALLWALCALLLLRALRLLLLLTDCRCCGTSRARAAN